MRMANLAERVRRGIRSLVDAFSGIGKPAPAYKPARVDRPRDPRFSDR